MGNIFSRILKTKLVSRLLKNETLQKVLNSDLVLWLVKVFKNKTLKRVLILIGIYILYIWLITTIFYEPKNEETQNITPEMKALDDSIQEAHSKTSPFAREYFIQQEAKRLHLTLDEYKNLYAVSKKNLDFIPDIPKGYPWDIIGWYYQNLNTEQRFQVLWNNFIPWLVSLFSKLAIFFVAGRFIWEIPQREKQAKYQAWQVIHAAHGQRVSGARIAALEDLLDQEESLAVAACKQERSGLQTRRFSAHIICK